MVTIRGKLLGPRHVELAYPVPSGETAIRVELDADAAGAERMERARLLTENPSFDFLRDEPDHYQ